MYLYTIKPIMLLLEALALMDATNSTPRPLLELEVKVFANISKKLESI